MKRSSDPRVNALLAAIDRYSIRTNPDPAALFDFVFGIMISCTSSDNPGGLWQTPLVWQRALIVPTQLSKPDYGLADCQLIWATDAPRLAGFALSTDAYALVGADLITRAERPNRPEDIAWARAKLIWLWEQALPGEPMPPITIRNLADEPHEDYTDFF